MIDRLTAALDIARGPHGSVYTGQLLADDLADVLAVVPVLRNVRDFLIDFYPDASILDEVVVALAKLEDPREHGTATLDAADLSRFIDDALEDWSTRPDPEPSDQVAVYLARRIAENIVSPPPAEPTLDVERLDAALDRLNVGAAGWPTADAIAREYARLATEDKP